MAFSCEIRGKNNQDLLEEYGINHQLLGLANNTAYVKNEPCVPYSLDDIRSVFSENSKDDNKVSKSTSRAIIVTVQYMIRENLAAIDNNRHCETCQCVLEKPTTWEIEEAKKFLEIPVEEVYKAYGGW